MEDRLTWMDVPPSVYLLTEEDIKAEEIAIEAAIKQYNEAWDSTLEKYDGMEIEEEYSEHVKEHELGVACIQAEDFFYIRAQFRVPLRGTLEESDIISYFNESYCKRVASKVYEEDLMDGMIETVDVYKTPYGKYYAIATTEEFDGSTFYVSKIMETTPTKVVTDCYNIEDVDFVLSQKNVYEAEEIVYEAEEIDSEEEE